MNHLTKVGIVLILAVGIILVVYSERDHRVTTHWTFWVGIILILGVFIGVPALMLFAVRNL
jgi:hypothetical protein